MLRLVLTLVLSAAAAGAAVWWIAAGEDGGEATGAPGADARPDLASTDLTATKEAPPSQAAGGKDGTSAAAGKDETSSGGGGPASGAAIRFDAAEFDAGRVTQGDKIQHVFTFTNPGSEVLEVPHVETTCGCTVTGEWTKSVPPGGRGQIPVTLDTKNFKGPLERAIQVQSNAREVKLLMRCDIWVPIEISPANPAFGPIQDGTLPVELVIQIKSTFEQPIELSGVRTTAPEFRAELEAVSPGREFRLKIITVPPLASGGHQGEVIVETGRPEYPQIKIPVRAYVQPAVTVAPMKLSLAAAPLANRTTRMVHVIHNATGVLKLSEIAFSDQSVMVMPEELAPGRRFRIVLTFPAGFRIPEGEEAVLSFRTSSAALPEVRIPVLQAGQAP